VVIGDQRPQGRPASLVVVPDRGGQGQDAPQDPDRDPHRGVAAVAFQVQLALEGLVDRFDKLPQRPEQPRPGSSGRSRRRARSPGTPISLPEGAAWDPPRLGGRSERGNRPPLRIHWGRSLAHPGELSAWPVQEKSRGTIATSAGASADGLVTSSCWGAERNATGLISGVCTRFGFMGTVGRYLLGARIVGRTLPPGREPLPRVPALHRSVSPWAARDPPPALGNASDPLSTSGRNACDGRSGCRCWQPR
jgi:hypothetical protein